jgi:type II secretory pathway predicted ATPase ExeA
MSVTRLQSHWGFTRMPFGRSLAPSMLHRHDGHAEAVARIGWCIEQHALGVITGEVGAGKTVAVRAATAGLDGSRHVVIYLPNPSVGVRGMLHHVVSALGQSRASTRPHSSRRPPQRSRPSTPSGAAPRS